MNDQQKQKLRFALSILSGREQEPSDEDLLIFGYDRLPPLRVLRIEAEEVVFKAIVPPEEA